jgi:hypothetical protein
MQIRSALVVVTAGGAHAARSRLIGPSLTLVPPIGFAM